MRKYFMYSSIIAILFLSYSCTEHKAELPQPVTIQTNTTITYSGDIKPILVIYCFGQGTQSCHVTNSNQGANGDFTTYAGLYGKVQNGSIQARVFQSNGGMPPSYSSGPTALTPIDLAKFKAWVLNEGAPNN